MCCQWIIISSLLILEIMIVRNVEANMLPTADKFSANFRVPPSTGGVGDDDFDEDDDYNMIVSRHGDILTSTQTRTGHYREITLTLTAFKETFILDLKLNTYLLSSNYIEKEITNGEEIFNDIDHVMDHCYYTGVVRDRNQSTAAVSTCKGITGYFAIANLSYHIEPKGHNLYSRHRVSRSRDGVKSIFRCGTDHKFKWMSVTNSTESFGRSIHRMKRSFQYPQDADGVDKVVEVYVANDRSQYLARGSDVNNVYRRTKDIVNIASLAYQTLGIYLVIVGVEVWTTSNAFTISESNVSGALASWYTYRQNSISPSHYNDNGILINNVAFYGGIVGKAIVGSMCSNQYSGAIISDLSGQAAVAGSTLAHEMGHNFGLQHDGDQCSCDDTYAYNHCIMYATSNANRPATKWSSCSKTQFTTSFSQGLDICLYNIPQTIFQPSSTCGNGIVEDGEQCDCGKAPTTECNPTCCSNTTCQLISSSTCASGRCCDTSRCQIKSSGGECRSKSNDCDLSQYCNGVDARCPTDSYKPDGTDCTNIDPAYCYEGECRSHRSQCELLWGPGTTVSNDLCYSRFNTAGAHYGNCGIRWTDNSIEYIPCVDKDVKCGKVQCEDTSKALYYYQSYYLISSANINSYSCHSVIFDYGTATQDPGLVPNGAKCGDKQMCVNQKCIPIPALPASIPPTTTPTTTTSTTTTARKTTPTTSTTFVTTEESNSTSPGVYVSGQLTGRQIALIVGLTVGIFFGLLILVLLIVLACRYRSNLRNFFEKKLRLRRQQKPAQDVSNTVATDQNVVYENYGYTSNERNSYEPLSTAAIQGPIPMRQAPSAPIAAFASRITIPPNNQQQQQQQQQQHNSVYSNFSEISTDQPWFEDGEDQEPTPITIYGNMSEVINPYTTERLNAVSYPQPPPNPQAVFNHGPANAYTNGEVVRSNKSPQLPVKPPVTQSKGGTLLPPTKPEDHRLPSAPRQHFLPTLPSKPPGNVSGGNNTTALQPPVGSALQNIPPKPPTKPPTTATNGAIPTDRKVAVDTNEEKHTLSVQQLMNKFDVNTNKPVVSATRPTPAQRKPPQFSKV